MDLSQFQQNPFIGGGIFLMAVGALLFYVRRLSGLVTDFVERFLILKLEILDEDEAYHWMQLWLADKLSRTLSISVVTRRKQSQDTDDEDECRPSKPSVYFVPAVGTYFFWYHHRLVTLCRNRRENSGSSTLMGAVSGENKNAARDRESFTLRIFSRNRSLARALVEECRDHALPDDGKIEIRVASGHYWSLSTRIKPRSLRSVILDGNQAEALLADIREFLNTREWYQEIGVPYRRGYLLYGPPGNGKTSLVKALAGELCLSVYLLMLSDPDTNDNRINDLLARVPERSILLLEDVDCAFTQRKRSGGKSGGVTFSGLLNAIDGVASVDGRILIMTTNHMDRLDPALIRPGRADVKLFLGNATSEQAERLFERFFPRLRDLASIFARRIETGRHSMATLQDYLMLHRFGAQQAIEHADEIGNLQMATAAPADAQRRDRWAVRN